MVQNAPEHHGNVSKTSRKHFYRLVFIKPHNSWFIFDQILIFPKLVYFRSTFDPFSDPLISERAYFGSSFFKTTRPISKNLSVLSRKFPYLSNALGMNGFHRVVLKNDCWQKKSVFFFTYSPCGRWNFKRPRFYQIDPNRIHIMHKA